jgi:tight adherence protein C
MFVDFLAALFSFLALSAVAAWALRGVGRPAEARIRALALARRRGGGLASISFQQRVVAPFIESTGERLAALLPGSLLKRVENRLVLAGLPIKPAAFYILALGVGLLFGGAYELLVFAATQGRPPALLVLLGGLFLAVGLYLTVFWLSGKAKARQSAMIRGLPDSIDLLTICVEAGLGLDAAFHRVAEKQSGPFVDEIRQMLREIGLGKVRREALLDLADRTDIEDVRSFALAVIQAEQLGTSLAQVLRAQSYRIRLRRRQRAEEEAHRASVKMVFPLVLCLMPSLFIFILGPIIVELVGFLKHG